MKPLNLIALLCFLGGATWALTRSDRTVRSIQNSYYKAIGPFLTTGSAVEQSARNFTKEVEHSLELEVKLEKTKADLAKYSLIEQRLHELEDENKRLREALEFTKKAPFTVIAARTTRRQTTNWYNTLEINRGQESFISSQNPVVTADGLVGKIDMVGQNLSTVVLLTDVKCLVAAKVEGSPEYGLLRGIAASYGDQPKLRLSFLSKNTRLKKGQRVFSDGRDRVIPANIFLGTIESIESGAMESEALVRPAVDFKELTTVFVIPKANE